MIEHRPFASLGRFRNDWLDARHHFSFGHYHDPARMQWGALRVWNDDQIRAGSGFDPHSHADMEIITYVRQGAITHKDSLGNVGRTVAGDVQVMSAGSGITHAEYNLESEETRIFQIWLLPRRRGGSPGWSAARFPRAQADGRWTTLASGAEDDIGGGALALQQDARVMASTLTAGQGAAVDIDPARFAYLVPARGRVRIGDLSVGPRDGAAIRGLERLELVAEEDAELVLVETV
jgi:redox-sensitive bicupin YhaK (pirin superfamily)